MAVRTYNPSVRVGNWCEDLVLEGVSLMCLEAVASVASYKAKTLCRIR